MSGARRKHKSSSAGSSKKAKKAVDLAWIGDDDDDDDDEVVSSDDDHHDDHGVVQDDEEEEEEEENETVDAKRVRLAREYLQKLEAAEATSSSSSSEDDEEGDDAGHDNVRSRIARKMQRDRLKREGTLERSVSKQVGNDVSWMHKQIQSDSSVTAEQQAKDWVASGNVSYLRGHDLTATCVALQSNGERAISGSKDNSVILWDVENEKRLSYVCPSWGRSEDYNERGNGEALAVACSDDGRYAAIGRRDATIQIFDIRLSSKKPETNLVKSFKGHKGPVTSLCFRTQSNQLFSGSEDRCVRHYSLDEMSYLETLYGHQSAVTAIDCHRKERPISVGMDRTARAWKLSEDTHLIFRGGSKLSWADCVTCIKDDWFVTGHTDGNLCLWVTDKKKAVDAIELSHGQDDNGLTGRSIASVASLKGSDIVMTGSNDGYLRLWEVSTGPTLEERGIEHLSQIPVHGFVNGIAVGPKARFCAVAVGQEPRLGRWTRVPRAKNRFGIIKLRRIDTGDDDDSETESPDFAEDAPVYEQESDGDSSEAP